MNVTAKTALALCTLTVFVGFLQPTSVQAQAMSAQGVATGGDKISAVVPQAANIYNVIDQIQALQAPLVACAANGLFYNTNTGGCVNPQAPQVDFRQNASSTFVDVQNAWPNHNTTATYGNLDGADGQLTLVD